MIEATGIPGQVHITHDCYKQLQTDTLKDLFTQRFQSGDEIHLEKKVFKCCHRGRG